MLFAYCYLITFLLCCFICLHHAPVNSFVLQDLVVSCCFCQIYFGVITYLIILVCAILMQSCRFIFFCSALLEPFVPVIQGLVVQYNAMSILFSCPITPLCYVLLLICFILAMKLEFCARAKPCSKDVRSCPSDVAITSFTIHQYQIYDLFCAA